MAKKKSSSSNIGLILTLIFFVLATFITGTLAYLTQEDVKTATDKAEEAKKKQATAETQFRDERVRKVMLRIAMGVEDPADRVLLVQELEVLHPQIREEFDRMKRGLEGKVPQVVDPKDKAMKSAFYWPLVNMSGKDVKELTTDTDGSAKDAATIGADPATGPLLSVPAMITVFKDKAANAESKQRDAEAKAANAEARANTLAVDKGKIEADFAAARDKITADDDQKHKKLSAAFEALKIKHAQDANNLAEALAKKGKELADKEEEANTANDKLKKITELYNKMQLAANGGRLGAASIDSIGTEEKKGEIVRKEGGGFVTINIGSNKKLRPQVTFLVVSSDVSWIAIQEKEKSLERNSLRNDRQPYEDNPFVKAGIEVVEILGPDRARAKILFENEPIRNPVQARDQIFNLAWQPAEDIRVAFAGIIDLDGDGLDNNEDFLRLLERQGVIVDEYLRLKPLEFVKRDGKGMSLQTKYLIIAPDPRLDAMPVGKDSPQTKQIREIIERMSDIKNRAKELGVQVIEARKFLGMIGYKLPRNPALPQYGSSAYMQGAAPVPAEAKKEGN